MFFFLFVLFLFKLKHFDEYFLHIVILFYWFYGRESKLQMQIESTSVYSKIFVSVMLSKYYYQYNQIIFICIYVRVLFFVSHALYTIFIHSDLDIFKMQIIQTFI